MNWKKLILPPMAIYAVIFLFISALIGAKMNQQATWVWVVCILITIVGLYLATRYAEPKSRNEGLIYGLIWLVIFFVLDLVLTIPFTGWGYWSDWKSYVSYALTLLMPTLLAKK